MKPLGVVFAVMLAVSTALAQHGGGHSGGGHSGGGGSHSGGSGGFHGSGGGGSVSGHGGHGGYSGGHSSGRPGRVYIAPAYSYGYYAPLAYGAGGYGSGYADSGYGYAAPAPQPVEEAPPPQAMDFGPNGGQPDPPPTEDGSLPVYTAPAPSPQDVAMSEGRYYLIAYKDHSVYTALAFWMENGALNYVTPQNAHNQVSLDRLDLALTKQMNSRHGMAFNLATP